MRHFQSKAGYFSSPLRLLFLFITLYERIPKEFDCSITCSSGQNIRQRSSYDRPATKESYYSRTPVSAGDWFPPCLKLRIVANTMPMKPMPMIKFNLLISHIKALIITNNKMEQLPVRTGFH